MKYSSEDELNLNVEPLSVSSFMINLCSISGLPDQEVLSFFDPIATCRSLHTTLVSAMLIPALAVWENLHPFGTQSPGAPPIPGSGGCACGALGAYSYLCVQPAGQRPNSTHLQKKNGCHPVLLRRRLSLTHHTGGCRN